ncbi:MAG TPA: hypothetical protein VFV41_14370 [Streptosporangiaceae bacterium]|nr:hypothetical protein [Streptosporangiaceae bacterium]
MSDEPDEALEVLRTVWTAQDQDAAALAEASGPAKSCKRMSDIGFGGMAGPDGDLRAAWKDRLAREGKLNPGATGSIRDLLLGTAARTGDSDN